MRMNVKIMILVRITVEDDFYHGMCVDPDPLQEENTMIRIRGRRGICKISACGICIPHCTEFYISQILQNHSATRFVFRNCQNTQQQMKMAEQTCCGQRKQIAYILRCGGNIQNYVLLFLQQKKW